MDAFARRRLYNVVIFRKSEEIFIPRGRNLTDAVRFTANVNTAEKIRVGAKYLVAFPATDRIKSHPY